MGAVTVRELSVRTGHGVLRRAELAVPAGGVVAVVGDATAPLLLRTVAGVVVAASGSVRVAGEELSGLSAADVAARGVVLVPAGWTAFAALTVAENVLVGARGDAGAALEALGRLPLLAPAGVGGGTAESRAARGRAGTQPRSGGAGRAAAGGAAGAAERAAAGLTAGLTAGTAGALPAAEVRALAVAVALARRPRVLLLDGLAAAGADVARAVLGAVRAAGVTVVVAERASFAGRTVAPPEAFQRGVYDAVFVARGGVVRPWRPAEG